MLGVGNLDRSSANDPCGTAHPYFTRKLPKLFEARVDSSQHVLKARGNSEAKRLGIRFEKQVCRSLTSLYGDSFAPQFVFRFNGNQRAILDGLLLCDDRAVIVEIKLRHTGDAFHQLWNFYKPIADFAFRRALSLSCLEICRYYDPSVKLPKPVAFVEEAREASLIRDCFHPVMIIGRL